MRTRFLRAWAPPLCRLGLVLALGALSAACTPAHPTAAPPPLHPGPASTEDGTGDCPAPGVLIIAQRGDAAAGYREMPLRVTNCADTPYPLRDRPDVVVLDQDRKPLDVAVVPSVHYSAEPRPRTLQPGVGAISVLSWRNTVTDSTVPATTGVFLSVAPVQGAPRQIVTLPSPLDLGNTGRLEASAWQ